MEILDLDINSYVNIWLGLSKFILKNNKNTTYKAILNFLYTSYTNIKYL